jgi:hypothetical protein
MWVSDVSGLFAMCCEEGVILTGEVVSECGGDGVGECEGGDLVD